MTSAAGTSHAAPEGAHNGETSQVMASKRSGRWVMGQATPAARVRPTPIRRTCALWSVRREAANVSAPARRGLAVRRNPRAEQRNGEG